MPAAAISYRRAPTIDLRGLRLLGCGPPTTRSPPLAALIDAPEGGRMLRISPRPAEVP
jgi:hypothetical protein